MVTNHQPSPRMKLIPWISRSPHFSWSSYRIVVLAFLCLGPWAFGETPPDREAKVRVEITDTSRQQAFRNHKSRKKQFVEGSELRVRVVSPVTGYLSLFHVHGENGKPVRIWPTHPDGGKGMIEKNKPILLPDELAIIRMEVSPPYGAEKLIAVVTAAPLPGDSAFPAGEQILAQGSCCYETIPGPPVPLRPSLSIRDDRNALVLPLWVSFDPGSARISGASNLARLRVIADAVAGPPLDRMHLRIEGHADNHGSAIANLTLSKKRAEAVAAVLRNYGIATERLRVDGRGSYEPVAEKKSPEADAWNRRVEIRLVDPDGLRQDFIAPE